MSVQDETLQGEVTATEMEFDGAFSDKQEQEGQGTEQGQQEGSESGKAEGQSGSQESGSEQDQAGQAQQQEDPAKKLEAMTAKLQEMERKLQEAEARAGQQQQQQQRREQPPEEFQVPDDLKEFADEYPEVLKIATAIADHKLKSMGGVNSEVVTQLAGELAQQRFEASLMNGMVDDKGNFVEGHPDAIRIVQGPHKELWAGYLKDQKIDANAISCPLKAIEIMSDFKAKVLNPFLADAKKGQAERTQRGKDLMDQAGASLGQSKGGHRGGSGGQDKGKGTSGQSDDFEGAFAEA